jgi:hypothetical protein
MTTGDIVAIVRVSMLLLIYPKQSAKPMETLEFVIYPDGRVQEKVTGIVGTSCAEVTAALEAELGVVLNQETTSEYFAQANHQSETATTQVGSSNW